MVSLLDFGAHFVHVVDDLDTADAEFLRTLLLNLFPERFDEVKEVLLMIGTDWQSLEEDVVVGRAVELGIDVQVLATTPCSDEAQSYTPEQTHDET